MAQERKLNKICQLVQLKEGMEHLDLGCGWGALINHSAKHFGTKPTGVTLSREQADFIKTKSLQMGVENAVKVNVMNAWDLPDSKQYDRITCVEMSEHIGIKN